MPINEITQVKVNVKQKKYFVSKNDSKLKAIKKKNVMKKKCIFSAAIVAIVNKHVFPVSIVMLPVRNHF